MRVFNESKTTELVNYDLAKGKLVPDKLFVKHHPATEEQWKWVREDLRILTQEKREAYDEYEDIQVYVPYTEKELAEREIIELKAKLAATDYKAIKYAEGVMSAAEYAETKAQREAWRSRINTLEKITGA